MARVLPPPRDLPSAIRIWGRTAPPGALAQLERIAAQPYVVGHVAAMLAPPRRPRVAVGIRISPRRPSPAVIRADPTDNCQRCLDWFQAFLVARTPSVQLAEEDEHGTHSYRFAQRRRITSRRRRRPRACCCRARARRA